MFQVIVYVILGFAAYVLVRWETGLWRALGWVFAFFVFRGILCFVGVSSGLAEMFMFLGVIGYVSFRLVKSKKWFWKVCGWIIALFCCVCVLANVWNRCLSPRVMEYNKKQQILAEERNREDESKRKREALESQMTERKRKLEREIFEKEEKLRSFILKEEPSLWSAYQNLQAELANQDKKIDEVRKAFEVFDKNPNDDPDYIRILAMRNSMEETLNTMRRKIEDAYVAACKYEATPDKKEYDELRRKFLEDGIREAESAELRFNQMRKTK